MAEVTFLATVDESRTLQLPPDAPLGRVEVVVREQAFGGNGPAMLVALRNAPQSRDPNIWKETREELARMRDEWDEE